MKPEPQEAENNLGKHIETFTKLPGKTKELELLKDQAEKATGQESVDLHQTIRNETKS